MSENKDIRRCLSCGGDLEPNAKGIMECIYCHREYPKEVSGFDAELQDIVTQRQLREFIKAEELCEELLVKQPESCEAHWQMVLARLGVVYVREGDKLKPTFFSCSYSDRESILDDKDYRDAIRYAPTSEDKAYYEIQARELDGLLKEFFNLIKKEANYDIFISFKQTEEVTASDGSVMRIETNDCRKAREIYEHLKDKYHVFFSPVSIGKDTGIQGEKYEPRILKALQSAQAMILVGFSEDKLKSQWVENEWRRYKYYIDKGKKKKNSLVYVYDKNICLPTALRDIQWPTVDVYEGKYLEKLEKTLSFVNSNKGLKSTLSGKKVNVDFETESDTSFFDSTPRTSISIDKSSGRQTIEINANEKRAIDTAESMLFHGKWADAEKAFKMVTSKNPQAYNAYWGEFKAKIKANDDKIVPANVANATVKDLELLDKAIEYSPSAEFSWGIIDNLIAGMQNEAEWKRIKHVYAFSTKYVDKARIKQELKIFEKLCLKYVAGGRIKEAEEVFENAKQIFVEEVKNESIAFMASYARQLAKFSEFNVARPYFEQLANVKPTYSSYVDLLACRLKAQTVTEKEIKLDEMPSEESASKKIADLTISEIVERIIVCDNKERRRAKESISYRIVVPEYVICVADGDGPIALTKAIRQKNYNLTQAKAMVNDYKLAEVYKTEEEAEEVASVLDNIGVEWAVAPRKGSLDGATRAQLVNEVMSATGWKEEQAKKFISDNKLFKKEYSDEGEVDYVIDEFEKIGVTLECHLNTGAYLPNDLESKAYETLKLAVLYQVHHNKKNVHSLMELIVGTYKQLGDKEIVSDLMYAVAEELVTEKDFSQAEIWYRELLVDDTNDAKAHWGTLKCKLKATNDFEISKHSKKLMSCQEFNNAINCADNEQHKYYMSVYYNEVKGAPSNKKDAVVGAYKNKSTKTAKSEKVQAKALVGEIFVSIIVLLLIAVGISVVYNPAILFTHVNWTIVAVAFGLIWLVLYFKCGKIETKVHGNTDRKVHVAYNRRIKKVALVRKGMWISVIFFLVGLLTAGYRTYSITEAKDLNLLGNLPSAGKATYILEEDIDFEGEEFKAYGKIKQFSGVFDGNGHTISNFTAKQTTKSADPDSKLHRHAYGLFKAITTEGAVKDLDLDSCVITIEYKAEYTMVAYGVITGINAGVIENCDLKDCFIVVDYKNSSVVRTETFYIGGIAGKIGDDFDIISFGDYKHEEDFENPYDGGSILNCSFINDGTSTCQGAIVASSFKKVTVSGIVNTKMSEEQKASRLAGCVERYEKLETSSTVDIWGEDE